MLNLVTCTSYIRDIQSYISSTNDWKVWIVKPRNSITSNNWPWISRNTFSIWSLPNIGKYLPCPNLCRYICCSLFESAYTGWSLVSATVCSGFIKVVADWTISMQCFCVPKSGRFCLINSKIKLKMVQYQLFPF